MRCSAFRNCCEHGHRQPLSVSQRAKLKHIEARRRAPARDDQRRARPVAHRKRRAARCRPRSWRSTRWSAKRSRWWRLAQRGAACGCALDPPRVRRSRGAPRARRPCAPAPGAGQPAQQCDQVQPAAGASVTIDWRAGFRRHAVQIGVQRHRPRLDRAAARAPVRAVQSPRRRSAAGSKARASGWSSRAAGRADARAQLVRRQRAGRRQPLRRALPAAEPRCSAPRPARRRGQRAGTGLQQQHTVLYAEDNPINVELVREVLLLRPQYRCWSREAAPRRST